MAHLEAIVDKVLDSLNTSNSIDDSTKFAHANNWDHNDVVGALNQLKAQNYIVTETAEARVIVLTKDGEEAIQLGSPEARVFHAIPAEGTGMEQLNTLGQIAKLGFAECMKLKWVRNDKASGKVFRNVDQIIDTTANQLKALKDLPEQDVLNLKKRRLAIEQAGKYFKVSKGPDYSPKFVKPVAAITAEMLASGAWKDAKFKEYNLNAKGLPPVSGHLHPLMKVRAEIRAIFLEMGFEEMPTNNYVESSFWNFDALFQPQQHPARDAHDTFFISDPAKATQFPPDYLERVKTVHSTGGYGSIGWRYDWKVEEAEKNILRTHTTAVSTRMLYKLAQNGFKPVKYFSIDRVFRNETLDFTHLAEFHQVLYSCGFPLLSFFQFPNEIFMIEGLVADYNITLSNLLGVISQFFERMGIPNVRFKPAFNPYTEPSMEIFGYHPALKRWVEVGNSGMFRPEMLQPMGLPENVNVIAWGLSLERPTMIKYGIDNIRSIFGPRIDLDFIKNNPVCFMDT